MYRLLQILFGVLWTIPSFAQILPAEGDTLNYRLIGFSVPAQAKTAAYRLDVAVGHINNEYDFAKNIITTKTADASAQITTVPEFKKPYTWRVSFIGKNGKVKDQTPLFHFVTGWHEYADTAMYRVKVIKAAPRYSNMAVLFDFAPVMYDMNGNLLWFLPDIPGVTGKGRGLRDLRPTPFGTFTLLNDLGAFELDYNGNVLWKAPDDGKVSGDSSEHYHHEFYRLPNGHYLIAGNESVDRKLPGDADTLNFISDKTIFKKGRDFYKKVDCPTIIEYDTAGKVVWSWRSADIFTDRDFFGNKTPDGSFLANPHMNSFYLDSFTNNFYISLRNFNRIIKLNYPSGKVSAAYGQLDNSKPSKDLAFRAQHYVRTTKDGRVYLFNNKTDRFNSRDARFSDIVSTVQVYHEDTAAKKLVLDWEFPCDIDTFALPCAQSGGSMEMLPDGTFLVGMGIGGRSFIVNSDKEVLWNVVPERKDQYSGAWLSNGHYRTSYIWDRNSLLPFVSGMTTK